MGAARAKWLRASGRLKSDDAGVAAFRPRHVAVCLRPQAVRAASRSACKVADHDWRMRRAGRALNSLCMGAAAGGTLSRPAAGRRSHATWLRACRLLFGDGDVMAVGLEQGVAFGLLKV